MKRELGMFLAFVCCCLVIGISNADFWSQANLLDTARQIAMLAIYTAGMAFVIIGGGIDLSVGSMIGLVGVVVASISSTTGAGLPLWLGVTIAVALAIFLGLGQGLLIAYLGLQPFIVTLAGMLLFRGVAQTITQGGTISLGASPLRNLADEGILPIGNEYLLPYPILIFLFVVFVATYLLHFTIFGRHVYALGGNRQAAAYCGVPVKKVELTT